MVTLSEKNVKLVIGKKGKPTGVLVDMEKAGYIPWSKARSELEKLGTKR